MFVGFQCASREGLLSNAILIYIYNIYIYREREREREREKRIEHPLYIAINCNKGQLLKSQNGCAQVTSYTKNTYPAASHNVNGHSHIPLRSGLLISDAIYSSGARPGRFSHSGTYPASGAIRSGDVDGSIVVLIINALLLLILVILFVCLPLLLFFGVVGFIVAVVVEEEREKLTTSVVVANANVNAAKESFMVRIIRNLNLGLLEQ